MRICVLLSPLTVLACAHRYTTHLEPVCPPANAETRVSSDRSIAGSIAGTVLDRDSGRPLREARLLLVPGDRTANSDSAGRYSFDHVKEGEVQLTVVRLGWERHIETFRLTRGNGIRAQIALTPAVLDRCFELREVRTPLPWWRFW